MIKNINKFKFIFSLTRCLFSFSTDKIDYYDLGIEGTFAKKMKGNKNFVADKTNLIHELVQNENHI